MKLVIRLEPRTIIDTCKIHVAGQASLSIATGKLITYAVVDEVGLIMKTSRGDYEIYSRKSTAQRVADWYNR